MSTIDKIKILGIDFYNGGVRNVVDHVKSGGLVVAPSGPGLATIVEERTYYESLLQADWVIPDSGYMALIWNVLHERKIKRISGLEFLVAFLSDEDVLATRDIILVEPRADEASANLNYLRSIGFKLSDSVSYLAPLYEKENIVDESLFSLIEIKKPKYVIVNLGGGIQEILGAYLKRRLSYTPGIICTGAAIAFLTGKQVNIPRWADTLFLGWLFRTIGNPKLYGLRYLKAFKLILILLRYGANPPHIKSL